MAGNEQSFDFFVGLVLGEGLRDDLQTSIVASYSCPLGAHDLDEVHWSANVSPLPGARVQKPACPKKASCCQTSPTKRYLLAAVENVVCYDGAWSW